MFNFYFDDVILFANSTYFQCAYFSFQNKSDDGVLKKNMIL